MTIESISKLLADYRILIDQNTSTDHIFSHEKQFTSVYIVRNCEIRVSVLVTDWNQTEAAVGLVNDICWMCSRGNE